MSTQLEIVNAALALSGVRATVADLNSTDQNEAVYAKILYEPLLKMLLEEGDYDFAIRRVAAVAATEIPPWSLAYAYPTDALRIRQLVPLAYDEFDPRPVAWTIYTASPIRILTNVVSGDIIYTIRAPEAVWSGLFEHSFTRYLASALAFAIANRLEFSQAEVGRALSFANIANMRDV